MHKIIEERIEQLQTCIRKAIEVDSMAHELSEILENTEVSGHYEYQESKKLRCDVEETVYDHAFNISLYVKHLSEAIPILREMPKRGFKRIRTMDMPDTNSKLYVFKRPDDPNWKAVDVWLYFPSRSDGITCRYVAVGEKVVPTYELRCFDADGNVVPKPETTVTEKEEGKGNA